MKRQSRTLAMLGLGSALLVGAAQAQPPAGTQGGSPPDTLPASSPGAPSGTSSSSQTITTTTQQSGDTLAADEFAAEGDATLAETGGEPWMLVFAGSIILAGGLVLRRRIS